MGRGSFWGAERKFAIFFLLKSSYNSIIDVQSWESKQWLQYWKNNTEIVKNIFAVDSEFYIWSKHDV